jgi:hypothetical protein
MEFMLTFHSPAQTHERYADPVVGPQMMMAWRHYMDAVAAAGVMRAGNRLVPMAKTTVRVRDGKRQVQDGPYPDSKELLGGYIVIDVPSLDDALRWAERSPSSLDGGTEVYPVMTMEAPK